MVVGADNKAAYREVTLGAAVEGLRVVTSGLTAGERIVVNGLQRVRPGALVAPKPVAMDTRLQRRRRYWPEAGQTPQLRTYRRPRRSRGARPPRERVQPSAARRRGFDMNLSRFFIDRPIFAGVLSLADRRRRRCWRCAALPISEYPEVVPPTVVVRAHLSRRQPEGDRRDRGDAARAADQRRRGHALHVLAGDDRRRDDADRHLQARHRSRQGAGAGAEPRRAGAAAAAGGSAARSASPPRRARPTSSWSCTCSRRTTATTCSTSATTRILQVKDELARIAGRRRGAGLRRRRLQHARLARSGEGRRARPDGQRRGPRDPRAERPGRGRRARRAAGAAGRRPPALDQRAGPAARREEEFGDIVVKTGAERRRSRACATSRASSSAPADYALRSLLDNKPAVGDRRSSSAGLQRARRSPTTCARRWTSCKQTSPRASTTASSTTRRIFVRESIDAVVDTLFEAIAAGRARRDRVPADLARLDHPAGRGAGLARRHVRGDAAASASRSTRCRCSAWCSRSASSSTTRSWWSRTSSATSSTGCRRARPRYQAMERSHRPDHRDRAGAVRGVRADGVHQRPHRPVLPAVRADDRDLDGHLGVQLADAVARRWPRCCCRPHDAPKDRLHARHRPRSSAGSSAASTASSSAASTLYAGGVGARVCAHGGRARASTSVLVGADLARLSARCRRLRARAGQGVPRRRSRSCPTAPRSTAPRTVIRADVDDRAEAAGRRAARSRSRACRSTASSTRRTPASCSSTLEAVRGARRRPSSSAARSPWQLNQQFGAIQDAFVAMFPPPPVQGLGTIGGFKL